MVATTYMWVLDRKVVNTQSIYTVEASNEDQALLMDIRKKDMTNNITIIMTFMMLEPLNWSPSVCETDRPTDRRCWPTDRFTPGRANFSLLAGLHVKPSPAAAGRCPWTAPPPSSRSHTSATVSEKRSHLQEKLQFYGPLTVQHPLYRGRHPHLGLKS